MPSPTRNASIRRLIESTRHLMILMMAMIFCLMGLVILHALDDISPQPPKKRKKKFARRRKKKASNTKNLPSADRKITRLNDLPTELLMQIFGYLAPDNVQPYIDGMPLHAYKQGHRDLRNVCLVSKRLETVARAHLYYTVIVSNANVLVYLLRTLDENYSLGQHVKRLVMEVPFSSREAHYQKPNAAVLNSRPNYSKVCKRAAEASDVTKYEKYVESQRAAAVKNPSWYEGRIPGGQLEDWALKKENEVIGMMHFELLLRTSNLESFAFRLSNNAGLFDYNSFTNPLAGALRPEYPVAPPNMLPALTRVKEVQLLADCGGHQSPYSFILMKSFLALPCLRTLKSFHDDGFCPRIEPRGFSNVSFRDFNTPSTWESRCLTRLDLQRSHCKPPAIFRICTAFPCLEYFFVSTEYGIPFRTPSPEEGDPQENSLSAGLAQLKHLRELVLDLHFSDDNSRPWLGPHGVLSLAGLEGLVSIRLPVHFLVEIQGETAPFVTDLTLALPSSLKHITVWTDRNCVKQSRNTVSNTAAQNHSKNDTPCLPRQWAIDFLESVSGRIADHFKNLEEVTYCYEAIGSTCQCDKDTPYNSCAFSWHLDPHAGDYSSARMQALSTRFEGDRIRLRTVEEEFQDQTDCSDHFIPH